MVPLQAVKVDFFTWNDVEDLLEGATYRPHRVLGYSNSPVGGSPCSLRAERAHDTWRHLFTLGYDKPLGFAIKSFGRVQFLISPATCRPAASSAPAASSTATEIPNCPGPCWSLPGASDAAGGVDARRWRILSSNPAISAASTPPPSATIQTFEPSLAGTGVAALGASTTSSTRATGSASSPTPGSVLAGRGVSPAVSFA